MIPTCWYIDFMKNNKQLKYKPSLIFSQQSIKRDFKLIPLTGNPHQEYQNHDSELEFLQNPR